MAVWCIGIGAGMSNTAAAADVPGSADHPLIPRYEGAEIVAYDTQAFTQRSFARAPIKQGGGLDKNPDAALRLEGKLTAITYRAPAERTSLEAIRNYQAALKDAGFLPYSTAAKRTAGDAHSTMPCPRATTTWALVNTTLTSNMYWHACNARRATSMPASTPY